MWWNRLVNWVCLWLCYRFPDRYRVIPAAEDPDKDLILQFMLIPYHLYLQHFLAPESYDWFHRHRWDKMRSFILSGWFTEERGVGQYITHWFPSTYAMDRAVIHRVDWWSRHCWTLLWVRGATNDWGYYPRSAFTRRSLHPLVVSVDESQYVPNELHIKRRVPNLETGGFTQ